MFRKSVLKKPSRQTLLPIAVAALAVGCVASTESVPGQPSDVATEEKQTTRVNKIVGSERIVLCAYGWSLIGVARRQETTEHPGNPATDYTKSLMNVPCKTTDFGQLARDYPNLVEINMTPRARCDDKFFADENSVREPQTLQALTLFFDNGGEPFHRTIKLDLEPSTDLKIEYQSDVFSEPVRIEFDKRFPDQENDDGQCTVQ